MKNENESTTATHNNKDAFHKHTIDQVSQYKKNIYCMTQLMFRKQLKKVDTYQN